MEYIFVVPAPALQQAVYCSHSDPSTKTVTKGLPNASPLCPSIECVVFKSFIVVSSEVEKMETVFSFA